MKTNIWPITLTLIIIGIIIMNFQIIPTKDNSVPTNLESLSKKAFADTETWEQELIKSCDAYLYCCDEPDYSTCVDNCNGNMLCEQGCADLYCGYDTYYGEYHYCEIIDYNGVCTCHILLMDLYSIGTCLTACSINL